MTNVLMIGLRGLKFGDGSFLGIAIRLSVMIKLQKAVISLMNMSTAWSNIETRLTISEQFINNEYPTFMANNCL